MPPSPVTPVRHSQGEGERWARWFEAGLRTATSSGSIGPIRPARARGAVVVAQEIFGVNSHIRAVCDDYAKQGYLAVAPALFDRVERDVELGYTSDDIARGRALREPVSLENALADMEAAVKEVAGSRQDRRGRLLLGRHGRLGVRDPLEELRGRGRLLWRRGHRARRGAAQLPGAAALRRAQDQSIPIADVRKMMAAHPEIPVFIYPAGHGFNCDQRASYHAESARLARERTLALFGEHVG